MNRKTESGRALRAAGILLLFSLAFVIVALTVGQLFDFLNNDKDASDVLSQPHLTVIIDAGHGGIDGGASRDYPPELLEKELNLDVALSLAAMLRCSGVDVILTREGDYLLYTEQKKGTLKLQDLRNRLLIAETNPNALFVSIHMNKFPQEKYSGLQVYYSTNHPDGEQLAGSVQSLTSQYLQPDNHRSIKAAGSSIYLLDRIQSPCILIECGFLSNQEEAERLATVEYRRRLSCIFHKAIIDYLYNIDTTQ